MRSAHKVSVNFMSQLKTPIHRKVKQVISIIEDICQEIYFFIKNTNRNVQVFQFGNWRYFPYIVLPGPNCVIIAGKK